MSFKWWAWRQSIMKSWRTHAKTNLVTFNQLIICSLPPCCCCLLWAQLWRDPADLIEWMSFNIHMIHHNWNLILNHKKLQTVYRWVVSGEARLWSVDLIFVSSLDGNMCSGTAYLKCAYIKWTAYFYRPSENRKFPLSNSTVSWKNTSIC